MTIFIKEGRKEGLRWVGLTAAAVSALSSTLATCQQTNKQTKNINKQVYAGGACYCQEGRKEGLRGVGLTAAAVSAVSSTLAAANKQINKQKYKQTSVCRGVHVIVFIEEGRKDFDGLV